VPTDWRRLSSAGGLKVSGDEIAVTFRDERQHRVFVDDSASDGRALRVWAVAAPRAAVESAADAAAAANKRGLGAADLVYLLAWDRNRTSDLVGYKIDKKGRLIGEAWVPMAGLDAAEWAIYVRTLAWSCDRVEYLLTGRDTE
jgi:hypothetical protein